MVTVVTQKEFINLVLSGLEEVQSYPLNFVKALIQLGHEPMAPFPSKTIFGKEKLFFPNTYRYLKHIYTLDGFTGLYRGLSMKIISTTVCNIVSHKVAKYIDENDVMVSVVPQDEEQSEYTDFIRKVSRDLTIRTWAIVVSHPFHVMTLRCMAQFVGGETKYSSWNIFHNALEIYRGEGISGFFNGLIPRMLFDVSMITIAGGLAYILKKYVLNDEKFRNNDKIIDMGAGLFAVSITYPLTVVSTVSCVSGANLVAGMPPKMPMYNSWVEIFKHLYESNGLRRGSSHFYRVYVPVTQFTSMSIY